MGRTLRCGLWLLRGRYFRLRGSCGARCTGRAALEATSVAASSAGGVGLAGLARHGGCVQHAPRPPRPLRPGGSGSVCAALRWPPLQAQRCGRVFCMRRHRQPSGLALRDRSAHHKLRHRPSVHAHCPRYARKQPACTCHQRGRPSDDLHSPPRRDDASSRHPHDAVATCRACLKSVVTWLSLPRGRSLKMGGMMFAGCLLIAYGPPAVLLLTYASRRSALLILTIARCASAW